MPEKIKELDNAVQSVGKELLDGYMSFIQAANDPNMWCNQVRSSSEIDLYMPTIGIH